MNQLNQRTPGQIRPGVLTMAVGAHTDWVLVDQIVRIQGDGNYSQVYTVNGRVYLIAVTLLKLGQRLPTFLRIHKSHLINPTYVGPIQKRIKANTHLLLTTGDEVPISRQLRKHSVFIEHFIMESHFENRQG
ncbi:LytR/AlgR family response regulator transcription factor [Larkinella rosea]|uniref:LytTR family transcriptional regulator n=1 Tax=Larkinella rosea TaxID=2025312 RepID=A0A3P1BF41_9BACT|nr:LytTR family DNA-binding domain-containing protein [Larkinella rosea]RRA99502.1 LytTR family transcriptional regulator [Larkinella rosea]